MSTEQRAMLGRLRRRFPGFEESMGRAVNDMANYFNEKEPFAMPKPVRGWKSVMPLDPDDPLPGRWIAYIHARVTETGQEFKMPVLPDEFNPHPTKLVRPDDKPHVFTYMSEAEQAADEALSALLEYIKSRL